MSSINDIAFWGKNLGLLPINLFSSQTELKSVILLDGGIGDFCLDINKEIQSENYYNSCAWSSNTSNFIVNEPDSIKVFNWKKAKVETIDKKKVENNFLRFYEYLISSNKKNNEDITPFIIGIFKDIRNLIGESKDGSSSLQLLFLLLTTIEEEDYSKVDLKSWALKKVEIPHGFEKYVQILKDGIKDKANPNLDLILRHSSGNLFQEAHREIFFQNRQFDLWGNIISKTEIKKISHSSIHYTPTFVARTIVENVLAKIDSQKSKLKIFDPACGSCEFLTEILKQLKSRNYQGQIEIEGWDSSELAISTSNFLLNYQTKKETNIDFKLRMVSNSLSEDWDTDYDIILMNPPFLSWEVMEKESRDIVKNVLSNLVDGKPNQSSAFLFKAINSLNSNGLIGCILPSSFLSSNSYNKLRSNLLEHNLTVSFIGKLGNFVFVDALTDVSILIAEKNSEKTTPLLLWTRDEKGISLEALKELRKFNNSNLPFIDKKNYSIYNPVTFPITPQSWKPISFKENELVKNLEIIVSEKKLVRISDIYNVKQGIRSGNRDIFKISQNTFDLLQKGEQKFFRLVVDNESIKKGELTKKNYIWYPYSLSGLMIHTEEQLSASVPTYYKLFLFPNRTNLSKRPRKSINDWWTLSEHRNWLIRKYPKLVSTEYGKSGSFAYDKSGEFAIEAGNGWVPKKEFLDLNSNYFYLSIFSSLFFNILLSIFSRQLLSGWDLGKLFTKNIPIPSVFSERVIESSYYDKLVEIGKLISEGNFYDYLLLDNLVENNIYPSN